jgi:hypothetical protein
MKKRNRLCEYTTERPLFHLLLSAFARYPLLSAPPANLEEFKVGMHPVLLNMHTEETGLLLRNLISIKITAICQMTLLMKRD